MSIRSITNAKNTKVGIRNKSQHPTRTILQRISWIYPVDGGNPLQTQGLTGKVSINYTDKTEIIAHNHSTPSPIGIQSLSREDLSSLPLRYVFCKKSNGDFKAYVAYLPNGGESMAYVDSKDKLNNFLTTNEGKSFLNGGLMVITSKIGKEFLYIKDKLQTEGYSTSTSYRYALTYILDYFQTGINMFYKEPGTTDFKLQSIQLETTTLVPATIVNGNVIFDEYKIINYKPIISK